MGVRDEKSSVVRGADSAENSIGSADAVVASVVGVLLSYQGR